MSRFLYRLGRTAADHPWRTIGIWFVLAVTVVASSNAFGDELEDTFAVPGLDSHAAAELLEAADNDTAGLTAQVVTTPLDGSSYVESEAARNALDEVRVRLLGLPKVVTATDTAAVLADGEAAATASGLVSPDGRVAIVRVQYPVIEELDRADLERLEELGEELGEHDELRVEMGGELFFAFGESETETSELIGLMVAAVVLLVAFGSFIAMGLPIATALFGLALGVSAMGLITYVIDIPAWAPQAASMVGIGVGIDYALFIITRHREHLAQGMTVSESAGRAIATAGQSVIFAGGTVVIAISGMAVAGIPFMTAAGVAIASVVGIVVVASVTLLPALLGLAGGRLSKRSLRRSSTEPAPGTAVSPRWERWGRHVTRHAWPYAIGVTVLLVALTTPILDLRLGFPDDGTLPEDRTERQAYDLVADGFGPGTNGPLVVVVDLAGDPTVVERLADAVDDDAGIAAVTSPQVDSATGVATILAIPTTSPQSDQTMRTVERLRSDVFPAVLGGTEASAHVGGQTATIGDIGNKVNERMLLFIGAVIALSFVLLMVVFRSVLVPLKAAFLNLLSIGAAYGVLVMVFQWGWGMDLIGLESTVPIVPFIPMFMFAILFGLSMDYEVFLLSRVREEYVASGDNDRSVIAGIANTARVITSAALIMISVFLGFVFGDEPVIKMLGLGLAVAIFVDSTIVRLVLVPATMKLMGDANWWLPAWLDRLLPHVDMEGEGGLPEPELVPVPPRTPAPEPQPVG